MKEIKLVSARFENFKKLNRTVEFGDKRTWISARNRAGKSSIADGIFWVLFGKSSTGKSEGKEFRPRPYDRNGVDVDHVDVIVELTMQVNGVEVVLKKTQRQNWVRKRGTTVDVHEGDKNIYSWNNVEISETEFKNRISDIISEKNFQLITNPTYFFGLAKKEKLELILNLIANITEEQILVEVGGHDELLEFVRAGKTLEEVRATAKRFVSDMTKERDQISAFINERSKDIMDVDVSDMELERNAIKEKIAEFDARIEDASSAVRDYDRMSEDIIELKMKRSETERAANEGLVSRKREIQKRIDDAEIAFNSAMQKQKEAELEIERQNRIIESNSSLKAELIRKYNEEAAKTFPDYIELEPMDMDSLVCPTCGQPMTEEMKLDKIQAYEVDKADHRARYDAEKASFDNTKKSRLESIGVEGKACADKIDAAKANLKLAEDMLELQKENKMNANAEKTKAMGELAVLPDKIDLSDNQEYEALCTEITKSEEALRAMNTGSDYRTALKAEKYEWEAKLDTVNKKFLAVEKSDEARDRVAELENQFKEKVQKIADQERILMMCEEFQQKKNTYLEGKINQHFKNVRFQLYRQQKNGGQEQVCDVYINGSPYGSNTTSGSEKLIAGIEVLKVISEIIGTKAFVIIDNAECMDKKSTDAVMDTDLQMALLSVSDDENMRIEVA